MLLKASEKRALVEALLACPCMSTRDARESVIKQLPKNIIHAISDNTQDNVHIFNIVNTCCNYPGGIAELIEAVCFWDHDTSAMNALDDIQQEIFLKVCTPYQLRMLRSHLDLLSFPQEILRYAYELSRPLGWMYEYPDMDIEEPCHLIIDQLAEACEQEDGTVPLCSFVEQLAEHLEKPNYSRKNKSSLGPKKISYKLRQWILKVGKEQGFRCYQRHQIRAKRPQISSKKLPYLLVTLQPDEYRQGLFFTKAWLLNDEHDVLEYLYVSEESQTLQQIAQLLESFHDYCLMKNKSELIVEFFLPRQLLCCDVDQWLIKAGISTLVQIGIEHQVIVRSLDRAYDARLWPMWKARWSDFQQQQKEQQDQQSPLLHVWDMDEYKGQASFYATLKKYSVTCLAMSLVLSEESTVVAEILGALIDSGVPVALWTRHKTRSTDFKKDFQSFLSKCNIFDLPRFTREMRVDAVAQGNDQHIGHGLTLLWDDPDHLPPDVQVRAQLLQAPIKRGNTQ